MTKKVVAFGNPVYDIISTPALRRSDRVLSGCSTNACLALAKLGTDSFLVGCVGPDYANLLPQDLNDRGIDSLLYSSAQTGGFGLIYEERGDRELSILGIANNLPDEPGDLPNPSLMILGPILGEVSTQLVRQLVSRYPEVPVLLDPQGLLRFVKDGQVVHEHSQSFNEIACLSTIVKANELETRTVTGLEPRQDPEKAVRKLHEFGCKIAIVTLAEAGSIIYDGTQIHRIPPYTTNAIDPTGAGDTYAAGFSYKFLENNQDLVSAGCFASSVASVMVENSGPDFPLTLAEATRRMGTLLSAPLDLKL
jgi:sugar/nucleoside kinase (ribokinase family)